ncbi:DUF1415 domain-containing protein [Neisseriaceae bacterium ESL0693]|nr:DUF1415 domain-containing protein [Neisseriaceae bacterium ESL0693]
MSARSVDDQHILTATRHWLTRAVIGLNLCPFAKAPYIKEQIRFCVSHARHIDSFLELLDDELQLLATTPAEKIETTLLIEPVLFADFNDFNDLLDLTDQVISDHQLDGVLQIAPFHPQFQFADTTKEDITNYTNRSPYPTLHLIREDSIDRAVAAMGDTSTIFERNKQLLRQMGTEGWQRLAIHDPSSET